MDNSATSLKLQTLLELVRNPLHRGAFDQASQLLVAHIEELLEYGDWQAVHALLPLFPAHLFGENPDLRYVEGLVYAKAGLLHEAANLLERAHFSYVITHKEYTKAVKCSLELARICLSRENFRTAYYHLHEEIQPLIERGLVADPGIRACFFLRMAELCPDIGKLRASIGYAEQALAAYKEVDDISGQFYALVRLSALATDLGDYGESESRLEIAEFCHSTGNLGRAAQARLLNLKIHLHWYRGNLREALAYAYRYKELADAEQFSNARVYARILLGNLQRNLGEFATAQTWYAATRQIAEELDDQRYYPWIDVQTAWLQILEGKLVEARALVYNSLKTSDLGQSMSFQVFLAVIDMLDGHFGAAERRLQESLAFYQQSGDELTCCALQFHLTQVARNLGKREQALAYVQQALGWFAHRRIDYFPHWWHPQLVGEVCAFALGADVFPDVVERIFVNRLGKAGAAALHTLLGADQTAGRGRAARLLYLLEGDAFDELSDLDDARCKPVLEELLQNGKLRRDGFLRLKQLLTTAQQRKTPNATLLAVFGMYANGYSRSDIAEKLGSSVANVRNYINLIYQVFRIPSGDFPNRRDRQKRLNQVAREWGFI